MPDSFKKSDNLKIFKKVIKILTIETFLLFRWQVFTVWIKGGL
jgi:hypothetical protein